jgi:hypothetical protein
MTHSSKTHQPNITLFMRKALAVALPALLGACSGDVVNVGENEEPLNEGTACSQAPVGDIVVWNQAELDALEGCTTIDGDLQIVPFAGADLRPLHALRSVAGQLRFEVPGDIVDAATLNDFDELNRTGWLTLDGLESLESVGGLRIGGLATPSLAPLSNLRVVVDGDLSLFDCGGLRDLHGLENIRGVDDLTVVCDELESMAALQVTGWISSMYINGARLTELGSLGVTNVSNDIVLLGTALPNLDAFAELSSVGGALAILNNSALTNVDGLSQFEGGGTLVVRGNPALSRLRAFDAISRLEGLMIQNNAVLAELPAFSGLNADRNGAGNGPDGEWTEDALLSFRPEQIEISDNPALRQFDVPGGWQSGSHVLIRNNAALERVGLGQLEAIDLLEIESNPLLADIQLAALATVDSLRVRDNPELPVAAFDAVQTFTRDMSGNAGTP